MDGEVIRKEHERISGIAEREYLKTVFGPENVCFVRSEGEKLILYSGEWFLKKLKGKYDISTADRLRNFLVIYPEYYARNVFSNQLTHMDNYVNFLQSFKMVQNSELIFAAHGRYYEERKAV